MNEYYVYEWFIKETNEVFYVGKGKNKRYLEHKKRNKFFLDMYNTHNCDVRKVLENVSEEDAFKKEKELISYYRNNTDYRLTNVCDGGEGTSGLVQTDEFRKKQSIIHKKRWENAEYRQKMLSIRQNNDGPYKSIEFRQKISEIVRGENNPNYGNKWSEQKKIEFGLQRKNNGLSKDEKNPSSKSIICLETGEVFATIKFAMEKYNVNSYGSFTVAIKQRWKTAGGLHWLIYEESLLDPDVRFKELLKSLSFLKTFPIICIQTKELFATRIDFISTHKIGIKKFLKEYNKNNKIVINGNDYVYVKDYIQSLI